jgi:hypothetical protein
MPDVRTLLADVTDRTPHADPVGAVHRVVRRRAARRRTGVAAGATLAVAGAVAAGTAVAARPGPRTLRPLASGSPAASPSESAAAGPARPWRAGPVVDGRRLDGHADEYAALDALVLDNPDALLNVTVEGSDTGLGWRAVVSLAADADETAWRARVAAAAGTMPWVLRTCSGTAAHYDAVAAEIVRTTWPTGHRVTDGPIFSGDSRAEFGCQVVVLLDAVDAQDRAYAGKRWGDDVSVTAVKTSG